MIKPSAGFEAAHALEDFGKWFDAPANEIADIEPFKLADRRHHNLVVPGSFENEQG